MRIGFIGAGQMATALAVGISKARHDVEISACDPCDNAVEMFRHAVGETKVRLCDTNIEVARESELVFIAVKPQVVDQALNGMTEVFEPGKTYISVVAGVSIARLQQLTGSSQIIRTMPNTPSLVGAGAIGLAAGESVPQEKVNEIRELFSQVGIVADVSESQINAVTGLSGSGPAFVYTFIEAMIDGGVLAGLPRSVARELVIQTVLGATTLVSQNSEHPSVLRDKVTSPGGTTIHGMAALEKGGFRDSVLSAILSATKRAGELGSP